MATIHDHFDGSAHCIECRGWCQLKGDDLELTRVFRNVLESYFYRGSWLPSQIETPMAALYGERWETFKRHGLNAMELFRQKKTHA